MHGYDIVQIDGGDARHRLVLIVCYAFVPIKRVKRHGSILRIKKYINISFVLNKWYVFIVPTLWYNVSKERRFVVPLHL